MFCKALPLVLFVAVAPLCHAQDSAFVGHYTGRIQMTARRRRVAMKDEQGQKLVHQMDKARISLDLNADHTYLAKESLDDVKRRGTWSAHGKTAQLKGKDGKNASTLTRQPDGTFIGRTAYDTEMWMTLAKQK